MRILEILVIIQLCLFVSAKITINRLKIPNGIESNKTDEVILDCDYSFGENDKESLVIKWFFSPSDYHENIFYQWIPFKDGSGKPQIISEPFKSIVDLDYLVSDNNLTMHRALKINKISNDITGNYRCKVESLDSEDTKSKKLVVYKKADSVELFHLDNTNMYICAAYGAFPKPKISIYTSESNLTNSIDDDDDDNNVAYVINEDDTYNVTRSYPYDKQEIKEKTQFICKLEIPDTDYFEIIKSYVPDNSGVIHRLNGLVLFSLIGLIFVIIN